MARVLHSLPAVHRPDRVAAQGRRTRLEDAPVRSRGGVHRRDRARSGTACDRCRVAGTGDAADNRRTARPAVVAAQGGLNPLGHPLAEYRERFRVATADLSPPVVVGCSGGADSLALVALAVDVGLQPVAVHVDHGLRPGSDEEPALVGALVGALGAAFDARRVAIEPGPNLEARARTARYAALEAARVDHGATVVLVAHTTDDQAETVLLNVLRGVGAQRARGHGGPARWCGATVARLPAGRDRGDLRRAGSRRGARPDERRRRVPARRDPPPCAPGARRRRGPRSRAGPRAPG